MQFDERVEVGVGVRADVVRVGGIRVRHLVPQHFRQPGADDADRLLVGEEPGAAADEVARPGQRNARRVQPVRCVHATQPEQLLAQPVPLRALIVGEFALVEYPVGLGRDGPAGGEERRVGREAVVRRRRGVVDRLPGRDRGDADTECVSDLLLGDPQIRPAPDPERAKVPCERTGWLLCRLHQPSRPSAEVQPLK